MSQEQESRKASLGRNPSSDYVKRRKSWQGYGGDNRGTQQSPDVRTFVGKQAVRQGTLRSRAAASCGRLPWQTCATFLLATLAVLVAAGIILTIIAVASHSTIVYTRWVEVRNGTVYYVESMDKTDAAILFATFIGAAALVILIYGLFSVVLAKLEARDLEQGDAPLKTKQSIAKLMSDAERQYVAEYRRKAAAAPAIPAKRQIGAGPISSNITVQKLESGSLDQSGGSAGIAPPRTWSLRRMLSAGRSEAERQKLATASAQEGGKSAEWGIPSSEMAAQLSSPDAFNRASSSHAQPADALIWPDATRQESVPNAPSTPRMSELIRQRQDPGAPLGAGATRILVTKPVEVHGEGSAPSDSEEEDYDKERQHSVLPHPAGASPFGSKVLRRFPQQGLEEAGPATSAGWQDVGLESDEEVSSSPGCSAPPGHIYAEAVTSSNPERSVELTPAEQLELCPADSAEAQEKQIWCHAEIELEEVLPRPQAGLLNRLLRLARVERVKIGDQPPAFVIHTGKEYMVGLKLKFAGISERRFSAKWIRIQPPDGQPVRFNMEEESSKAQEWSGSACWDTSLHSSEALASPKQSTGTQGISLQVTIGLGKVDAPGQRMEAHGLLHVLLYTTLHASLIKYGGMKGKIAGNPAVYTTKCRRVGKAIWT